MREYYPIMIKSSNVSCIIFGGGQVAYRKVKGLLEAGVSSIHIVSPQLCESLQLVLASSTEMQLTWSQESYKEQHIAEHQLVFAATNDAVLNSAITKDAYKRSVLACNVSDGEQGAFITPSVVREGDLTLSISTGGTSPAWGKQMKKSLQQQFAKPYSDALRLMARLRADLERDGVSLEQKKVITERAIDEVLSVSYHHYEQWYISLQKNCHESEGEE